jgi:hypothetical protein
MGYILVKVLHYSLIRWERHIIASQDRLTLVGELVWRQQSRPRLHRRLTLRSPSGTLGMEVATRVTMRVVVITLGFPEPSLRARTSASARYLDWYAPLERYISYEVDQAERAVEGIRLLERWMNDFAHVQTEM